jgi:2-deoxy-D-gluconate 3-dehydrogenase
LAEEAAGAGFVTRHRGAARAGIGETRTVVKRIEERFGLDGAVAVVTGGRGGIGAAIGDALASAGATVILLDKAAIGDDVAARDGSRPTSLPAARAVDVADESAVDRAFADVVEQFGRVDVLVNSAGVARRSAATEHTVDAWNEVMAVNLTGTFLCCRSAARHMIAAGRGGAIVNVASIMGLSGGGLYPNISYQASKGAVVNLTRSLALEWAPHRIRVNAVAPTYVRTDFIKAIVDDPQLVSRIEAMTPLGRLAEPDEVADAVLFRASPAAAMVTGHILAVDGGYLAQ